MVAHWTERQLLTTDNWVELVAPLPKDEHVSSAVASYSVDKLFETVNVESKITEVLPPRAAFLAPPLSERLKTRTTNLAQDLIQSDQFQSVWISANRIAHQKLMAAARGTATAEQSAPQTSFQLKLDNLLSAIKDRMGSSSNELFANTENRESSVSLSVNLKAKFTNFKRVVNITDFLNSTLLLAALACLVGALAISRQRFKLFAIMIATIATIALLQLIGIKALRPAILNQIENSAYQPAAGVVYDELAANFQRAATTVFIVSLALFSIFLISRWRLVSRNKTLRRWLAVLRASQAWKVTCSLRIWVGAYRWPLFATLGFLVLAFMAFIPDFDWQGVIRGMLGILIILGLINLIAVGPADIRKNKKLAA